jgi:hypothetical protein
MDEDRPPDTVVRIVTIVCLTVIVVAALIGITVVAVRTDRDVHYAEGLSFAAAVLIAVIGGFTLRGLRHHRRWRIERENGADE